MSEASAESVESNQDGENTSGDTSAAGDKTLTQAEVNALLADQKRKHRAEAADWKAKAAKLDEYEQANQTEAEKSAKRIADLEAELGNTRRDSLRIKIASANGITDAEDIDLFLTGTDEETLTKQAKRLAERTADRKKSHVVPGEGKTPSSNSGDDGMREFARGLFKRTE